MGRPRPIDATVVRLPTEPRHLAERTRRWIAAAGFRATVKNLDDLEWARSLTRADRVGWWVASGSLPIDVEPVLDLARAMVGESVALLGERARTTPLLLPSDELHRMREPLFFDWGSALFEPKLLRRFAKERLAGAPFHVAVAAALAGARVLRQAPLGTPRDARLRVFELITSLQRGGAERLVLELGHALQTLDVTVVLATTGRPTRGAFDVGRDVIATTSEPRAIEAAAIAAGADVIHAHLLPQATVAALAQGAVPLVVTVHNAKAGWPRGLANAEHDPSTLYVACSQGAAHDMAAAQLPLQQRMIWNGIMRARVEATPQRIADAAMLRASLGLALHDRLLLTVANPRRQKRFDRIPAILSRVLQRAPEQRVRWAILGEQGGALPDAQQSEKELASALANEPAATRDALVRLPPRDDVAAALHAADVIVSVSDWEGLSLAHLEALAANRPLVATAAGGTVELAAAAPDLTLLDCTATDDAIADAIVAARPATGSGAQLVHARFATTKMAERYRAMLDYAAARATTRPDAARATTRPDAARATTRRGAARAIDLCLVINNFSTGGAQTSARRLLNALLQRGLRVAAITVEEQPEYPTRGTGSLRALGVPVFAAPAADLVPIEEAMRSVLRWLGELAPRATLFWNLRPAYKVRIADAAFDRRLFDVSPGEMNFTSLERFFARPIDALPYRTARDYGARLAGAIVKYVDEKSLAETMLGTRVAVIGNGVPLARPVHTHDTNGAPLVVGTSARLSPQKQLEDLIDAVAIANRTTPMRLRIAGDPERGAEGYREQLVARAAAEHVALELCHGLDEVGDFLRSLDLFALIAEPPGCPNASLEALAHGLPVIATDVGGIREQIHDHATGRLVPRGNISQMAAALIDLARSPVERARLARAGQEHVAAHFTMEQMADRYVAFCIA